jgi:hydroxyacylglutathione hydrolase
MKVQQIFFKNTLRNFSYLITFSDGAIFCIDPFSGAEVLSSLKGEKLTAIINTHDHCDHHDGNAELYSKFRCSVMCHEYAKVPHKDRGLRDEDIIHECGEWQLSAVDTPGHTLSHICLVLKKNGKEFALFTGDCFFNAGVGNCHSGSMDALYTTIDTIFSKFPDEMLIYPGHEYLKNNLKFTMSIESHNAEALAFLQKIEKLDLDEVFFVNDMSTERKINTFLRLKEPEIKKALKLEEADDKKVFTTLRELRNNW